MIICREIFYLDYSTRLTLTKIYVNRKWRFQKNHIFYMENSILSFKESRMIAYLHL
jgi:hypothetical protein